MHSLLRMKSKISIVTLGVQDLAKSIAFYKKLGFKLETEQDTDKVAFFLLEGSAARLGLFPRVELAKDIGIDAEGSGFSAFTLAHNVASPEAVDSVLHEAEVAGATIIKPGQKVFWGGYSGYFADPDGFHWEVAHNPFMDLT